MRIELKHGSDQSEFKNLRKSRKAQISRIMRIFQSRWRKLHENAQGLSKWVSRTRKQQQ